MKGLVFNMGMCKKECNYNLTKYSRKCKYGAGKVYTIWHVTEESDYPPFETEYTEYFKTDCPNNCESL